MLAAYGIDVLDPKVTPRRIWSLARRLPAGAWPGEAMAASWSIEAHLLAGVMDLLANLTFVTARAYGSKTAQRPKPLERPGSRRQPVDKQLSRKGQRWADVAKQLTRQAGVTVTHHG